MNLYKLVCVGKNVEGFLVLRFIFSERRQTRALNWDKPVLLYYFSSVLEETSLGDFSPATK